MQYHEITVTNIQSGDTISYPLLIIKGLITNNSKALCQSNKIQLATSTITYFKVTNNNFKAVAELDIGENTVHLEYCCSSAQITVIYCPRSTRFTVLPLYIICEGHDGNFQAPNTEKNDIQSALKRITVSTKLLQSVTAEKLYEENKGRKTFQLEDECRVFKSSLDYLQARKMNQHEIWTTIGEEILNSNLDHERIKFLGFLSCTNYRGENYKENLNHDDILKITEAHVALGGGGLALFGTACLYTWPENLSQVILRFEDQTPINKKKFMDDSCYRGTLGACFSTTLGAVLHELYHTFDLGHTEIGIMGRGFDDIHTDFVCNENEQPKVEKKLAAGGLDKFHRERKKLQGNADSIFLTRSCVTFLAFHRWFNNFEPSGKKITFDPETKLVSSTAGIRVIEVRSEEDGMVLLDWSFDARVLKFSFQLPEKDLRKCNCAYVVVVEDNNGNVLKHSVNKKTK